MPDTRIKAEPQDVNSLTAEIFSPENLACPYATWHKLRNESPVARVTLPGPIAGAYVISRKSDIEYVASHPELFASEVDSTVWRWGSDLGPDFAQIFADGGYQLVHTVVTSDPPRSQRYRQIVLEALSLTRVKARIPRIQAIVDRLITNIPDGQTVDFRSEYCTPLPLLAILEVYGLAPEYADYVYRFTTELISLVDPTTPQERALGNARTVVDAQKFLARRMEQYRLTPEDNFLSFLANARGTEGELLSMEEALSIALVTVVGGNETTRNALATAAFTLARKPQLWRQLQENPEKVRDFVEEIVRFGSPAQMTPRQVVRDTQLGDTLLPKGAAVFVLWGSGSHDEKHFPDPDEVRLDRKNGRNHTSFGFGTHHCAGIHLARTELTLSINAWLAAFQSMELGADEADIKYTPALAVHALSRLPLRIQRKI